MRIYKLLLLIAMMLIIAMPVMADQEPLWTAYASQSTPAAPAGGTASEPFWSNFNAEPVQSYPECYEVYSVEEDEAPVQVQRIRTYHWNDGKGAVPGTITVWEDGEEFGTWDAEGTGEGGFNNIFWDLSVNFTMNPGHYYYVTVSDPESMSYNEASDGCGFVEYYGIKSETTAVRESVQPTASAQYASASALPETFNVGQIFTLGRYEQDNDLTNGAEPIEWVVLAVEKDQALVVSRYVLDVRDYLEAGNTWEEHKDRAWLNNEFYNSAFTNAEKGLIQQVTNENLNNPVYGTPGGNQTEDRIFYLSVDEADYFTSDDSRKAIATAYAESQGIMVLDMYGGTTYWSLRTPGETENIRAFVDIDGAIDVMGIPVFDDDDDIVIGVRPAFWLGSPEEESTPEPTQEPNSEPTVTAEITITPGITVTPNIPDPLYCVFYNRKNCASTVPAPRCYRPGTLIRVQYAPLSMYRGKTFTGWDMNGNRVPDFSQFKRGNTFIMPNHNVYLDATCRTRIPIIKTPTKTPTPTPTKTPIPESTNTPTPTATPTAMPECYKVTYEGNGCLSCVPADQCYRPGELVTVQFSPVCYMQGLIFNGWSRTSYGSAEFGYYYNTFTMPNHDVVLSAICSSYYQPEPPIRPEPPEDPIIIIVDGGETRSEQDYYRQYEQYEQRDNIWYNIDPDPFFQPNNYFDDSWWGGPNTYNWVAH